MNIVITGASNGIGLALARFYADQHRVFNLDLAAPADSGDPVGQFIRCDLTSDSSIRAAVKQLPARVDLLIHNAGIMRRGALLDLDSVDMDALYRVFVRGPWLMTKLLKHRRLKVVMVSSFHVPERSLVPAPYVLFKDAAKSMGELLELPVIACYMGPVQTQLANYGKRATAAVRALRITPDAAAERIVHAIDANRDLHYHSASRRYRLRARSARSA